MSRQVIKDRYTGATLYEGDFPMLRECVEAAAKAGADLAGADLAGADLARADLAGANLAGANLAGAYLARADLARADLAGANLGGAIWRAGFRLNRAPVRTAQRSDGYTFYLLDTYKGWRVAAGCRFFTFEEAWEHWCGPNAARGGTPLGDESEDILVVFSLALDRENAP